VTVSVGEVKDLFELLSYVVVLIGVPLGLAQYVRSVSSQRRTREYETYSATDDHFISYMLLCLDNPELDVFDVSDAELQRAGMGEKKREVIAFTLLFSILERAFLMYSDFSRDTPTATQKIQKDAWDGYLEDFARRGNFQKAWELSGHRFDERFQVHVDAFIRAGTGHPTAQGDAGSGAHT